MDHLAEGAWAERVAERRLRREGWEILRRNTRISGVEVDIVARRRRCHVLWEVKRVQAGSHFPAMGAAQRRRLKHAAISYAVTASTDEIALGLATVSGRRPFPRVELVLLPGEE